MTFHFFNPLKITVDREHASITVSYSRHNEMAYYDICDTSGRVIRSGRLQKKGARVDLRELKPSEYVLLILDGKRIERKIFSF
jgi:hypothetical protein